MLPLAGAAVAYLSPSRAVRLAMLPGVAVLHAVLVLLVAVREPEPILNGWMHVDSTGLVFLGIASALFFFASLYAVGYLKREDPAPRADYVEGIIFANAPESVFVACMLLFLASMTLVTMSQNLGMFWVGMEATTLVSAPLISFHRHHRSLEARYKYLLVCSVGIAIALLGTLFLSMAASPTSAASSLMLDDLLRAGAALDPTWLHAAFILLLVGYGTKMGLVPLHTWLPDAHSESPSLVSALMSGALLNCGFLGILRGHQVLTAAGEGAFTSQLLVVFGLLSMGLAAFFIIRQGDYKRMLAYSSIEHMGILSLGVGLGGVAVFGAMFHAVNHSLSKGLMFLVAGNVLATYKTTSTRTVRGMSVLIPISSTLWIAGFLAITGAPPFGSFLSEFIILQAIIGQGSFLVAALYLGLLAVAFIGMATVVLRMVQGRPWEHVIHLPREAMLAVAPPAVLAVIALTLGLYLPSGLQTILADAAHALGGVAP